MRNMGRIKDLVVDIIQSNTYNYTYQRILHEIASLSGEESRYTYCKHRK